MLMCVIEFGTLPGMDERNRALVAELMVEARKNDGFISKEAFTSRDNPGKVITISYWRDEEALPFIERAVAAGGPYAAAIADTRRAILERIAKGTLKKR